MLNARILVGLLAADANLVFLETEKLAKVCEGLCGREAYAMLCKILPRFKVFIFVEMIFDVKNKYTCNDILSHAKKMLCRKR